MADYEFEIAVSIAMMDIQLNRLLKKLEYLFDLQMLDLKYGMGYTDHFMDKLLKEINEL